MSGERGSDPHDALSTAAQLAAIEITPGESDSLRKDLDRIIGWVGQMSASGPAGEAEASSDAISGMRLRDDEPRASLPRESVAELAPSFEEGLFVVPPVITDRE